MPGVGVAVVERDDGGGEGRGHGGMWEIMRMHRVQVRWFTACEDLLCQPWVLGRKQAGG
jgi:hypothetical protein